MKRSAFVLLILAALGGLLALLSVRSCDPSRPRRATFGERVTATEQIAGIVRAAVNGEPRPPDADPWGTPYAVFTLTGEGYAPPVFRWEGQDVRPATELPISPPFVQVISAGPDRVFGTADDLHSWDKPPE